MWTLFVWSSNSTNVPFADSLHLEQLGKDIKKDIVAHVWQLPMALKYPLSEFKSHKCLTCHFVTIKGHSEMKRYWKRTKQRQLHKSLASWPLKIKVTLQYSRKYVYDIIGSMNVQLLRPTRADTMGSPTELWLQRDAAIGPVKAHTKSPMWGLGSRLR